MIIEVLLPVALEALRLAELAAGWGADVLRLAEDTEGGAIQLSEYTESLTADITWDGPKP